MRFREKICFHYRHTMIITLITSQDCKTLYICVIKKVNFTTAGIASFVENFFNLESDQTFKAEFLNAVYFRRGLTCTLGLTKDLIDGGQPRVKPHRRKASLKTVFSPRLATVYQVVG